MTKYPIFQNIKLKVKGFNKWNYRGRRQKIWSKFEVIFRVESWSKESFEGLKKTRKQKGDISRKVTIIVLL